MFRSLVPNRAFGLTTANLRTPSIRFRYGASRDNVSASSSPLSGAHPSAASTVAASVSTKPGEPIYDFQIPARWKRRPLSEEEIAYINRGGPE